MTRILYPLEYVYQLMICEHFIRGVYHGIEFVKLNLIQQMLANHQLINVFKWAQNFERGYLVSQIFWFLRRPAFTEENSKFIHVS